MATQEWEEKMNELRDALLVTQHSIKDLRDSVQELRDQQLVTQRLIELNERKWEARFERHDDEIAELRAGMLELRSAMSSLIAHIDRFIQGRQPNGH